MTTAMHDEMIADGRAAGGLAADKAAPGQALDEAPVISDRVPRPVQVFGRLVRELLLWVGALVGTCALVVMAASTVFSVTPLVLQSGSMAPAYEAGALAFARTVPAGSLEVGDVVSVVDHRDERVTHRVEDLVYSEGAAELTLRGDANHVADPRPYVVEEADRVMFAIPGGGYVVAWLLSPAGLATAGVFVGLVLFLGFVVPPGAVSAPLAAGSASASSRRGSRSDGRSGIRRRARHAAREARNTGEIRLRPVDPLERGRVGQWRLRRWERRRRRGGGRGRPGLTVAATFAVLGVAMAGTLPLGTLASWQDEATAVSGTLGAHVVPLPQQNSCSVSGNPLTGYTATIQFPATTSPYAYSYTAQVRQTGANLQVTSPTPTTRQVQVTSGLLSSLLGQTGHVDIRSQAPGTNWTSQRRVRAIQVGPLGVTLTCGGQSTAP